MISAETIAELEARKLLYILGVRERTDKLVRDLVLDDPAPFVPLFLTKRRSDVEYEAKAVALAGRRYIVCRNHDEMKKDAADRAAILAALERQLKKGDKSLVGNKGYRRFLATPDDDHFAIDRAKAEEDAKFDGVFVLRTNADLSPLETMLVYKQLVDGGAGFPNLERPVRNAPDLSQTRRDHPRPRLVQLPRAGAEKGAGGPHRRRRQAGAARGSWPDILADLDSLTETEVEQDGKRFLLRSAPRPAASLALRALGVALPPTVRQLGDA